MYSIMHGFITIEPEEEEEEVIENKANVIQANEHVSLTTYIALAAQDESNVDQANELELIQHLNLDIRKLSRLIVDESKPAAKNWVSTAVIPYRKEISDETANP
ncbi:unnamed protein product [Trichobilharzia regenti]|nr:unnamed protein product [Trichobilharzia regenti]